LFFIGAGDRLFAATVRTHPNFSFDPPKPLFQACPRLPEQERAPFMYRYDVGSDGTRTLWSCSVDDKRVPTVALHSLPRP
jgi:hypothetical protein